MIFGSTVEARSQQEYSRSTYMNRCWDYGNMVYKYIDIVGTSKTVITDAINNAFEVHIQKLSRI
jgi:Dodecin